MTRRREREALRALARSLTREAGVLCEYPELTRQQLYNDVQWSAVDAADGALRDVLDEELRAREAHDQRFWLRRLTRPARSSALLTVLRAGGDVFSCAFSPDGSQIVSGAIGVVELWDVVSGRRRGELKGEKEPSFGIVDPVAFSQDGGRVMAGCSEHIVRLWEADTGRVVRALRFGASTTSFAFSPDLTRIAGPARGAKGGIWRAGDGEAQLALAGGGISPCAFSRDGARLAMGMSGTAEGDGALGIWDAWNGERLALMRWRGTGMGALLQSCAFSPDGLLLATAGYDGTLRLWDTNSGREIACLVREEHAAGTCVFSPDGAALAATAGAGGSVTLWDVSGRTPIAVVEDGTWDVRCLAFSSDGTRLAVGGGELVRVWDVGDLSRLERSSDPFAEVNEFAYSPDGSRILTTTWDSVRVRRATSGDELAVCKGHEGAVLSFAFSPDGRRVVTGGMDGTVRVWDATSGRRLSILEASPGMGHAGPVVCCAFSPDGFRVASASHDETVRLWDIERPWYRLGRWLPVTVLRGHDIGAQACAWSPDGARVVSGGGDSTVRLWDAKRGRQVAVLEGHTEPVNVCAFSPDGSLIASCAEDGTVRLWDAGRAVSLAVLGGHSFAVRWCAFSSDGALIVSAGDDMTVRVWDVASGAQLGFAVVEARAACCAFRPGSAAVIAAGTHAGMVSFALSGPLSSAGPTSRQASG